MKKSSLSFSGIFVLLALGLFACGSSVERMSSSSFLNTDSVAEEGEIAVLTWSSSAQGASIFQNSVVSITFGHPNGVNILSATAFANSSSLSQVVGLNFTISEAGNTVSFSPVDVSGWPIGYLVDLCFSVTLTDLGTVNDCLDFSVFYGQSDPVAPDCAAPGPEVNAFDNEVIYSLPFTIGVAQLFRINPNTLAINQITTDFSLSVVPNFDYDGRISFEGDRNQNAPDFDIYRVDPDGQNLCIVNNDTTLNAYPALSPFWTNPGQDKIIYSGTSDNISYVNAGSGLKTDVLTQQSGVNRFAPHYCPNGLVVYISNGTVRLVDPDNALATDAVINNSQVGIGGSTTVKCCEEGGGASRIIFSVGGQLQTMNIDGSAPPVTLGPGILPDFSEDCSRVTYIDSNEIFLADFNGSNLLNIQQLTNDGQTKLSPTIR